MQHACCLHLHFLQLVHGQLLKECILFSQTLCSHEPVHLIRVDGFVKHVTHFLTIPLQSSLFTHSFLDHSLTTIPELLFKLRQKMILIHYSYFPTVLIQISSRSDGSGKIIVESRNVHLLLV